MAIARTMLAAVLMLCPAAVPPAAAQDRGGREAGDDVCVRFPWSCSAARTVAARGGTELDLLAIVAATVASQLLDPERPHFVEIQNTTTGEWTRGYSFLTANTGLPTAGWAQAALLAGERSAYRQHLSFLSANWASNAPPPFPGGPTAGQTIAAFYQAYATLQSLASTVAPILEALAPDWYSASLQLGFWQGSVEWSSRTGFYGSFLGGGYPSTGLGFNVSANWALPLQSEALTTDQLRQYIEEWAGGMSGYYGLGGGVQGVPGTGFFGQLGVGYGYGANLGFTPRWLPEGGINWQMVAAAHRLQWYLHTGN